jgi:hypothetical protein
VYEVRVFPSMTKGEIVEHIFIDVVIDVNIQCIYIIMMIWYEQRDENPCTEGLTN